METKRCLIFLIVISIFGFSTNSAFPETLDILSPSFTIATDITSANSDTMEPGKSALGFDGTNYLLVSCRADISPPNIFGVLVSNNGTILNAFPISNLNPSYGCTGQRPAVAFDGTNYLVVFSRVTDTGSGEIAGTLIAPSGAVINEAEGFRIISGYSDKPAVAYDGSNYLVVAQKYNEDTLYDIYGARINTSGQVFGELLISSAVGDQVFPSIAFDGTNYFVIWSSDGDILGSRVTQAGVVLDPAGIPISTAAGIQDWPQIIFTRDNYFAVWQDTRNAPEAFPPVLDIFGTRITQNGIVLDGDTTTGGIAINTYPIPKEHPVVSFDGINYVVIWEVSFFYNPPVGIYAARISVDGSLVDGPSNAEGIFISQPSSYASRFVWPNVLSSDKNLFLSWINNTEVSGEGKDIYGALFSIHGDVNNDGYINLTDAILALKVNSNTLPQIPIFTETDINNDAKIGLEEAINALQFTSGIRTHSDNNFVSSKRTGIKSITNVQD